ncbi:ATP-dependent translocase ABCB1 [Bulinus truncatus]|nr:ATP-dependent translocase ABCB1 [Bulinus truncatus]
MYFITQTRVIVVWFFWQVFFSVFQGSASLGLAAPILVSINVGRGAAYAVFKIIDKILNGFDLTINPGQTVALVGASGCGKSTLIQLMMRFYDPDNGKITVDGVDLRDINIKWLRQQIGLVSQEPVLFGSSILENIRYGRDGTTMEEVIQACKDANAYEFIKKMPQQFDTHVGERGAQLSGGQKQRIAIARALVKRPKVLLLDEATSALDNTSEAIVQDALDRASKGRTTIIVAHRLSTIRNADVIVVLDKGSVAEKGTHDELMARKGHYYNLVSTQNIRPTVKATEANWNHDKIGGVTFDPHHKMACSVYKKDQALIQGEGDFGQAMVPIGELDLSASTRQTLKRLLKMNSKEWHYIVLGSLASFFCGAVQPAWAVALGEAVYAFTKDDKEDQKDTMAEVALYAVLMAFINLFTYFLQDYMFGLSGEALTQRMRQMLFRSILRQEISWFDDHRHETGILSTQLSVETSVVQGAVKTLVGCLLLSLGNMGTAFIISFIYGWQLTLALMGFIPFLILCGLLNVQFLGGAAGGNKKVMEEISKGAMASVDNIRTVASLTREETFFGNFKDTLKRPFKNNMIKAFIAALAFSASNSTFYFSMAICFYYGSRLLKDDEIDFQDIFKVFGCMIISSIIFGRSVALAPDLNDAMKAAKRIFALHDYVPRIDPYSTGGLKPAEGQFKGSLRFTGAFFRYPMRPDVIILNGLELTVEQGQTLALVGESGCGKSTTIQLIERFYDLERGSLFFDNYDVKDLNVQWLRAQIGLVSQEPVLFDLTIADNIAYGDNSRTVSMDEIIKAARSANIHNFIASLPEGYQTSVGKKGTQLSGGQKQRIAIARAIVRNPKILLLDEATSALDAESEKVVQDALDKAKEGRTCITIAHRLSTIKDADKIAVFKAGVVTEIGNHSQLMALRGLYYELVLAQAGKQN